MRQTPTQDFCGVVFTEGDHCSGVVLFSNASQAECFVPSCSHIIKKYILKTEFPLKAVLSVFMYS